MMKFPTLVAGAAISLQSAHADAANFQIEPRIVETISVRATGERAALIGTTGFIVMFTPQIRLTTQVAFDNIVRRPTLTLHIRWDYVPNQEFSMGVGQSTVAAGFPPLFLPRPAMVV